LFECLFYSSGRQYHHLTIHARLSEPAQLPFFIRLNAYLIYCAPTQLFFIFKETWSASI
jgi:hypothetical protein